MQRRCLNAALICMLVVTAGVAAAMDMRRVAAHLITSGVIDGEDLAKLRDVVADPAARAVDTVISRDSPGGDYWMSQRIAEFIRDRGWRTAVSGYCFSGCALAFLGGRQRHFTDDKPALQTQLAFQGTYYVRDDRGIVRGELNPVTTHKAHQWMKRYTEGKISDTMLERFAKLPQSDLIHFFDSGRLPRKDQASVFVCPRDKQAGGYRCTPIAGTDVYREGIVTSNELIRSADRRGE